MRRIITDADNHRHRCDTDKARPIAHRSFGNFGDPAGYEETLYKNRNGFYFVFGIGGKESPYPPEGDIRILDTNEAF